MDWSDRRAERGEALDPATEDLLWQLSSVTARACGPPVVDDEIARYRRGEMPEAEQRRFEIRLAGDERGMERMAALPAEQTVSSRPLLRLAISVLVAGLATIVAFYFLTRSGDPIEGRRPPSAMAINADIA